MSSRCCEEIEDITGFYWSFFFQLGSAPTLSPVLFLLCRNIAVGYLGPLESGPVPGQTPSSKSVERARALGFD